MIGRSFKRVMVWGLIAGGLLALITDILLQPVEKPLLFDQATVKSAELLRMPRIPWDRIDLRTGENELKEEEMMLATPSPDEYDHSTVFSDVLSAGDSDIAMMPQAEFPNPHLNRYTDNLNVLFVGTEDSELRMVAVYSINIHDKYQSGAVFFPVTTYFQSGMLKDIYRTAGVKRIQEILEEELEVDIDYYVWMDKRILTEVKSFLDPIIVDGQPVDIENLFVMEVTPRDEEILGKLMEQLTRPKVYFLHLPKLVFAFKKYMRTDFRPTLENLKEHFLIARNIDTQRITKVIAGGHYEHQRGRKVWVVPDMILKNVVYQITQ